MRNPFKKEDVRLADYVSGEFDQGELADDLHPSLEVAEESIMPLEQLEQERISIKLLQIIRGVLLALVFMVPIFMVPFTAPGDVLNLNKQILIYGLVMAGVILWLAMIVRQGGVRFKISGLEWGILAFVGTGLLAAIFSDQVYRSFFSSRGFVVSASLAVLAFLFLNFFERREISRLTNYFIAGSFLAVLSGVLSLYGVPVFGWISYLSYEGLTFSRQFNTVGSVHNLGALATLLMVMISSSYFSPALRSPQDHPVDWSAWLMPVVKIGGAVSSAILLLIINWWVFYAVLAAGMMAIIIGPGLAQGYLGMKAKFKAVNLIGPLVILVLSLFFLIGNRYVSFNFPGRENLPVEVAISQRGSYEIAKGVISTKFPFGTGQDNFSLAFDQYKPSGINGSVFWDTRFGNATSELWNLIVQTGAVGIAGLAFLLFFIFRSLFRKGVFDSEGSANWLIVMPVFISCLTLFLLYPFGIVLNFVFWFLIGLWAVLVGRTAPEERLVVRIDDVSLRSIFSSLGFVLTLVLGLVGGYLVFQKYQGEIYFAKAARINLASAAEIDKAIELLGNAVEANQSEDRYLKSLAQLFLSKINTEVNNKTDQPEEVKARFQGLTRSVLEVADQMTVNHPHDAPNWSNAGFVYANLLGLVGGADQAALSAYGEYIKRAPKDPSGYVRIGTLYLRRADTNSNLLAEARRKQKKVENEKEIVELIAADYRQAEANYKKAIELKRDLATALYNLGVVYDRQAQIKNAIKQLELTKLLDQNNPGLAFELGLLYYRNSQKDNALAEMARAVNLSKDYSNARWYLALILEEKGEIDLAINQLQAILSIEQNKDNQTVLDKIAALESGKRELPPGKVTSKLPLE